ncbi:hypothetical protein MLD38_033116 [Melastoma candidum]|uniref:Uncharacterized protein n=1 Tax=Melastoma candidum TaxID=119954 RepID=A0ACB9M5H1_9MYRT|nr:hypothetical protein MLD38_033116 [Melastoma candidum]
MAQLPIAVAYSFFLGFWLFLVRRSDDSHPIHPLMSRVLLVKSLTSLTSPFHALDDPIIQCGRILLLLALAILLVETTRVSLVPLRRNLSKKAVTAVIAAQVLVNVALGEMEATSSLIMASMAVNVVGGFSVLGCILWHISQLGEELKGAKKLVLRRAVDRVSILLQWYTGGLLLYYTTRVLSSPLGNVSSYAEGITSLVYYGVMFYRLRPEAMSRSDYFSPVEEDAEAEKLLP